MLKWLPPSKLSGLGNISFFATVVKNKATFWVKLESPKLSPMVSAKTKNIYFNLKKEITAWFITVKYITTRKN